MSKISFEEIMDFYSENNRSVYEDLKEDYIRGVLTPFVGAGMSAFCGYLSWKAVLKELVKFIYAPEKQTKIAKMIDHDELLQAAQEIHNAVPRMLRELKKIINYEKIEKIQKSDKLKLYSSAVYVLPYLFPNGAAMTTNFDRVLEEVYQDHRLEFEKIVSPYEPDLLTQMRQKRPHCLFKLHGDIGRDTISMDKLVFTQDQYNKAYAPAGALVQELAEWFKSKKFLFLGCSLAMDKTMEVLKSVTEQNSALDHYAILACSPNEMECRIQEMGALGISAIYYPDGKHDAVRVILERLLEDVNHTAYESLNRKLMELVPASSPDRRFMFNSNFIAFSGREDELRRLDDFCQSTDQISWWAVTGPGGMGKSRLVYEFAKIKHTQGWDIHWLNPEDYRDFTKITPSTNSCIIVADDVQAHLQAFGAWLATIMQRARSEKLRIILLERDGADLNTSSWGEMLQAESPYADQCSFGCYDSEFLQLEPLPQEHLKSIIENYAQTFGKPVKSNEHTERLLQALAKVDSGLMRPIYALAISDAWCKGKDPTRWDKKQILDMLVNHELDFYYKRLFNIYGKRPSKKMISELENLLARSCLTDYLPINQIAEQQYPWLYKCANGLDMDFFELLHLTGIVHQGELRTIKVNKNGEKVGIEQVRSLEAVILVCPDLIKEHLVLRQVFDKGHRELIFSEDWDSNPQQVNFCRRILNDYPERLDGQEWFWKCFLAGDPKEEPILWVFAHTLFGITAVLPNMSAQAVDRLEKVYSHHNENEIIAGFYAKALVNHTADKDPSSRLACAQKLEKMYQQFQSNEDVAEAFAKALYNALSEQESEEKRHTAQKLEKMYDAFQNNEIIAEVYADILQRLAKMQQMDIQLQYVKKVELLHLNFQSNTKIALAYVKGLRNLATHQESKDRLHSAAKVEKVYHDFQSNEEIAIQYVMILTSLMVDQSMDNALKNYEKIKELHSKFESSLDMAEVYSGCFVNLSFRQTSEEGALRILNTVTNLLNQHPDNIQVQLSYAMTFFNLTLQQHGDSFMETVVRLREFLQIHQEVNKYFQEELDKYLSAHPDHTQLYQALRF